MVEQPFFKLKEEIIKLSDKAEEMCKENFAHIEQVSQYNQNKVLNAFIKNGVGEQHLVESTGYGYGDEGRDVLDKVFADAFECESALVRHTFTCGTHTLGVALFGILRPEDTVMCVTGTPYDTIHDIFGISGKSGMGSLKDFGVKYKQVDLKDGAVDIDEVKAQLAADKSIRMVYIQRSRGYALRDTLSVEQIGEIAKAVKSCSDAVVFVDNCYGEFTQKLEPVNVGADLMAGSLIKNAGGGIARTGGYIAGKEELVKLCSYRATVPGIGDEVGCTLGQNRNMYMGFFNAPHVTEQALKTAVFASALFELMGYKVSPRYCDRRYDIIEQIELGSGENLCAFCEGIQSGSPIDSFVKPEPWEMPGYDDPVIMSAGAFIGGASIELSADGPMREPYAVWMQGGLNYYSAKMGIMLAANNLGDK